MTMIDDGEDQKEDKEEEADDHDDEDEDDRNDDSRSKREDDHLGEEQEPGCKSSPVEIVVRITSPPTTCGESRLL